MAGYVGSRIVNTLTDLDGVAIDGASITNSTIVPTSSFMFRNKIINGNFDIWQRGTSQTSSGYGSADRWSLSHVGSSKTASQQSFTLGQTEVPGNPKYYLRQVITSVAGASNYVVAFYRIENVSTLAGKTATLSFWAKADGNKNIATEFYQFMGSGGSPSADVNSIGITTYSLTTSWQKFTTTISIPSISGIGTDGNDYLQIIFWFESGSTYSSRNNSLGQQSGTFDIAQVQLEEGSAATPFEQRPIGVELGLCQRYYQDCGNWHLQGAAYGTGNDGLGSAIMWPTTMRNTPIIYEQIVSHGGSYSDLVFNQITKFGCSPEAVKISGYSGSSVWYIGSVQAESEL